MAQTISRRRIASTVVDQLEAGEDRQLVVNRLAAYMLDHRLTSQGGLMLKSINEVLAERGHVHAEIVSARELSGELKKQLESYISEATDADKVSLEAITDPAVLGGLIIRTPTHELDASIRTTLRKLRNS